METKNSPKQHSVVKLLRKLEEFGRGVVLPASRLPGTKYGVLRRLPGERTPEMELGTQQMAAGTVKAKPEEKEACGRG